MREQLMSAIGIIILFFILYCVIPNYWARNHSRAVVRTGDSKSSYIALTFDDGPNPEYTPKLLDILKEHGVKATFFVVGKNAKQYPHILRRIHSEGHLVGCHSYSHRHAWLLSPMSTIRDLKQVYKILEDELKQLPGWYRPPWGMFNLLTLLAAKKMGLKTAYWSIEAQDWESKTTPQHIYNTVISRAKGGSIIVLHDSGGATGAPARTLEALPSIISALKQKGYKFVTLEDMKGDQ